MKRKLQLKEGKKMESEKRRAFVDQLELSSFRNFRLWTKAVVIVALYVFVFYYQFIHNSIFLLASQGLLTKIDILVNNKNISVIAADRYEFEMVFNRTTRLRSDL